MGERGVAATGAACGAFGVASSRVRDGVAAAGAACGAFGSVDPWGRVAAENIPPGTSPLDKSRSASASVTGVRIALSLASSSSAFPPAEGLHRLSQARRRVPRRLEGGTVVRIRKRGFPLDGRGERGVGAGLACEERVELDDGGHPPGLPLLAAPRPPRHQRRRIAGSRHFRNTENGGIRSRPNDRPVRLG